MINRPIRCDFEDMSSISTVFVTHELKGALKFKGRKFNPPLPIDVTDIIN
jgi:hypothetical protein